MTGSYSGIRSNKDANVLFAYYSKDKVNAYRDDTDAVRLGQDRKDDPIRGAN